MCVCVFQQSFSNSLCVHLSHTNTLHGYLYPYITGLVEGLDRWSEGSSIDDRELERSAWTSKDHPSMSMVEPWSNHIFRAPRRISCILRGYPSIQTTSCCPSQTRRIVDLVNLQTDFGHRLHTDRIQTKYRHKCTNKLPLGCSFVFIFYRCRLVLNFDGLWSSSYQNSDVLSSLQCRRIFKVFTS
ncbi:hypothetical protein HanXRQr2_Chr16g0758921 [Helianthus annuus]|uniref:Uncharacterized protein n=1 Tax=Helianthus annuus TaxID=4232 RepID=A0A9K3DSS5_HELAN|nr:hypothetical protein HanXRQr2_Chr16g0758921 [Helianthus annuus]